MPKTIALTLLAALLETSAAIAAPQTLLLWPGGAPNADAHGGEEVVRLTERGEHILSNIHAPSVTAYLPPPAPAKAVAVIIVPGGGHTELWMDHEGYNVAAFLQQHGVASFILKYRLARAKGSKYTVEGDALADVQRAIRTVRARAVEWAIDPERVGVIGFSAGGELAALAATRYDRGVPGAADSIERMSSRPDFQALLYPSIPKNMKLSKETPPAFLLCGADDTPRISQGLAQLYLDLRHAGAAAELHIYAGVGHGFGLRASNRGPVTAWPQELLDWLDAQGLSQRP